MSVSYALMALLLGNETPSPWYLEITFAWGLFVLAVFTPFAIRRAIDIGISKWWVVLLWLPPFFNLKFLMILSKYADFVISGAILWPALVVALFSLVYLGVLFFSPSETETHA
ncbi:MAG: hypothetical protein AB2748_03670 [Candidatus Thiodiazotropha endolucinida]